MSQKKSPPQEIDEILSTFKDDNPLTRIKNSYWYGLFYSKDDIPDLLHVLKNETNPKKREWAVIKLGRIRDSSIIPDIVDVINNDQSIILRRWCVWALGFIGSTESLPILCSLLKNEKDKWMRVIGVWAIGEIATKDSELDCLINALLHDSERLVRWEALNSLAEKAKKSPKVLNAIKKAQESDTDSQIREIAFSTLKAVKSL